MGCRYTQGLMHPQTPRPHRAEAALDDNLHYLEPTHHGSLDIS